MPRLVFLLNLCCGTLLGQSSTPPDFATDILPILSRNCFLCHGPDESTREADLRLDLREIAIRPIDGGPGAIVPGKPKESLMVERILAPDILDRMPPEDSGHTLTVQQIQALQDWIADGAPYARHWSFVLPRKLTAPSTEKHPIDGFVFQRLRKEGFQPSPPADRRTLIRRVSLDLIGLPPTEEQVSTFINDKKPGAYDRVVDSLLASSAYGERWGVVWLDLARFADSKGYAQDGTRSIWRYRDWLIDALNTNMPFDEFTYQQMAGDLMPNATVEQRLATAFHRNTLNNEEGGTDDEEFRVAAVMDRIESSLSIWMGLTMQCARCHTHKYDPISITEYYQVFDLFNHTQDADKNDERPHLVENIDFGKSKQVKTPVLMSLEGGKKRATHILEKGNFLTKGKKVEAGVPAAFNPWPTDSKLDRMGFARWLMAPDNPLTARVTVNRFWSRLFGKGIVVTEEDFGRQGAQPSHPELLDFLAVRFQSNGWDMKAILRFIVTSKTYKQSSRTTADHVARDPDNTLLSRGARFHLPAEMIRDQALVIGGLLSTKMHGPSVFPRQPPGLWQAAFSGSTPWKTSEGEDAHRRGLYTFWRRTVPYPALTVFDAPSRNTCSVRRIRTNTPLQALTTLNDPNYMEAAQGLARRMAAKQGSQSHESRIAYGFRMATCRYPTGVELKRLSDFFNEALTDLMKRPDEALSLATVPIGKAPDRQSIPELAAYSLIGNIILNLDAVLNQN